MWGEGALDRADGLSTHCLLDMIKNARLEAGLTQGELARRVGVAQPTISDIESGSRRIDVIELLDLLRVLNIVPADFIQNLEVTARGEH